MTKIKNFNDAIIALANYFCEDIIPFLYNVSMTDANTEYSQVLPDGTKKVLLKLRGGSGSFKLAYTENASGTNYITIPAGSSKFLEGNWLSSITLYFQSPVATQIMEIEVWK